MKNSEKLLAAIGEASDKNIPRILEEESAETGETFIGYEKKKEKNPWIKWGLAGCGLIAAVAVIAFVGISAFHNLEMYGSVFAPNLITIDADMYSILGGEKTFVFGEPSDFESDNPWRSDMDISSMPVYKKSEQAELSRDKMERIITEAAEKLGLTEKLSEEQKEYSPADSEKLISLAYSYNGTKYMVDKVEIKIGSDGTCVVTFGTLYCDVISLIYKSDDENAAREKLTEIGEKYNSLLGFDTPTPKITNDGRIDESEVVHDDLLRQTYGIFDGSGNVKEQIFSYFCKSAKVEFVDNAFYSLTFGGKGKNFEFMGEYPIISYEEAVSRLIEGKSITEIPVYKEDGSRTAVKREDIGYGELVYLTVDSDYIMPFYKFRVRMEEIDSSSKYGLYYVPAVKEKYWQSENMTYLPGINWEYYGGNGVEILYAYAPDEIGNDNPWNGNMEISELPVYKNLIYSDHSYLNSYLEEAEIKDIIEDTAGRLGLSAEGRLMASPWYIGANEDVLYSVKGVYRGDKYGVDQIGIEVNTTGEIKVDFGSGDTDGYKLPDGLSLDGGDSQRAALEYVAESFKELFGYENPTVNIDRTGRSGSGEMTLNELYIYDGAKDNAENILNFSLNRARVSGSGDRLETIWLHNKLDYAAFVGDYPIISPEEATKLLTEGRFYGSFTENIVQNGKLSEDVIVSAELIYRSNDNYYLPFYRFCVKTENGEGDMNGYGALYVPAVEEMYLVENNTKS